MLLIDAAKIKKFSYETYL